MFVIAVSEVNFVTISTVALAVMERSTMCDLIYGILEQRKSSKASKAHHFSETDTTNPSQAFVPLFLFDRNAAAKYKYKNLRCAFI